MNLGLFLLATLALNITPGPDMLYVMGRSLGQGTRAGVVSALGIGVGTLVHMVALAVGLSTLLTGCRRPMMLSSTWARPTWPTSGIRTILSKGETLGDTLAQQGRQVCGVYSARAS